MGHHRQEEQERAINYLSFEVSTTAAAATAADSFPALFSFSKQKNICLSHFYSLTPRPRPPSATLPLTTLSMYMFYKMPALSLIVNTHTLCFLLLNFLITTHSLNLYQQETSYLLQMPNSWPNLWALLLRNFVSKTGGLVLALLRFRF